MSERLYTLLLVGILWALPEILSFIQNRRQIIFNYKLQAFQAASEDEPEEKEPAIGFQAADEAEEAEEEEGESPEVKKP